MHNVDVAEHFKDYLKETASMPCESGNDEAALDVLDEFGWN